jgi:hypothetical protein
MMATRFGGFTNVFMVVGRRSQHTRSIANANKWIAVGGDGNRDRDSQPTLKRC